VSSPRVLKPEEKSDELKAPEDKVDALKSESEAPEVKLDEPRDP